MVLGLSFGEVVFLLGATVALIGPKELPVIARAAGRLTGKAVGFMQKTRGQVDDIFQLSQFNQVQNELQEAMSQLDAIRHEIRTGMSVMHQRPYTRESAASCTSKQEDTSGLKNIHECTNSIDMGSTNNLHVLKNVDLDQTSVNLQSQATAYARLAAVPQIAEMMQSQSQIPSLSAKQHPGSLNQEETSRRREQFHVFPVSASDAGLLPPRKGSQLGGSDLVLETLVEQKVAHQALEFLQQPHLHNV